MHRLRGSVQLHGAPSALRFSPVHWLLRMPAWKMLFAVLVLEWLEITLFALLVWLADGGSFSRAVNLSVQTCFTIGYGSLMPDSELANLCVCAEAFVSLLTDTLLLGVVYLRFSRPQARLLFSKRAIVSRLNGQLGLAARCCVPRQGQVWVKAEFRMTLLHECEPSGNGDGDEGGDEGVGGGGGGGVGGSGVSLRMRELPLLQAETEFLGAAATVIHPLDDDSPLMQLWRHAATDGDGDGGDGGSDDDFRAWDCWVHVECVAFGATYQSTVRSEHLYHASDLAFGAGFGAMVEQRLDQKTRRPQLVLDVSRLNRLTPSDEATLASLPRELDTARRRIDDAVGRCHRHQPSRAATPSLPGGSPRVATPSQPSSAAAKLRATVGGLPSPARRAAAAAAAAAASAASAAAARSGPSAVGASEGAVSAVGGGAGGACGGVAPHQLGATPLVVVSRGIRRQLAMGKLFWRALNAPTSLVLLGCTLVYFGLVAMFACSLAAEAELPDAEQPLNTRGGFDEAFFFAAQTISTIGYGGLLPVTPYAHTMVAVWSTVGLVTSAIISGLLWARLATLPPPVRFAAAAVVTRRDGRDVLLLRIADALGQPAGLARARLTLSLLRPHAASRASVVPAAASFRDDASPCLASPPPPPPPSSSSPPPPPSGMATAAAGMGMGMPASSGVHGAGTQSLPLVDGGVCSVMSAGVPFTAMHVIDDASPLRGLRTAEQAAEAGVLGLFALVEGYDRVACADVVAYRQYLLGADEILFGADYEQVVTVQPSTQFGRFPAVSVRYDRFGDVRSAITAPADRVGGVEGGVGALMLPTSPKF